MFIGWTSLPGSVRWNQVGAHHYPFYPILFSILSCNSQRAYGAGTLSLTPNLSSSCCGYFNHPFPFPPSTGPINSCIQIQEETLSLNEWMFTPLVLDMVVAVISDNIKNISSPCSFHHFSWTPMKKYVIMQLKTLCTDKYKGADNVGWATLTIAFPAFFPLSPSLCHLYVLLLYIVHIVMKWLKKCRTQSSDSSGLV